MTYIVSNYLTGSLLFVSHKCANGVKPNVNSNENWQGTSKGAEADTTREVFEIALKEGIIVEKNWQDADCSSRKALFFQIAK